MMRKQRRPFFSWLCVFLVLFAGPMQARRLVFCSGCEGAPEIEFSAPDGSCSTCPDKDSSHGESSADGFGFNGCGCVDEPLKMGEFINNQHKDYFQSIVLAPPKAGHFLKAVIQEKRPIRSPFSFAPLPPNSLAFRKSVVRLI